MVLLIAEAAVPDQLALKTPKPGEFVLSSNKGWTYLSTVMSATSSTLISIGVVILLAGFGLKPLLEEDNLDDLGIQNAWRERSRAFESVTPIELLRAPGISRVDVLAITMNSFLVSDEQMINQMEVLVRSGVPLQLLFADLSSTEVALQDSLETNTGKIQTDIRAGLEILKALRTRLQGKGINVDNFRIGQCSTMPRVFVLRAGPRMLVANYLFLGSKHSPTLDLVQQPGGLFQKYEEYIDQMSHKSSLL